MLSDSPDYSLSSDAYIIKFSGRDIKRSQVGLSCPGADPCLHKCHFQLYGDFQGVESTTSGTLGLGKEILASEAKVLIIDPEIDSN